MVKRVSCRVVSSKPFRKSSDILRDIRTLNKKHLKVDNIIAETSMNPYRVFKPTVNVQSRRTSNSTIYTGRLGTIKVSTDNVPMGQILDCYA